MDLPDRPVLTLKSSELNVTNQSVKENDTVKFVCVGKARPKPSVKLMRDEQLLKSTDPSSGPPRPADSVPLSQLNITYKGTQAQLTLDLVAYPLPNVTVTYDAIYADGANTPRLLSQDKFNGTYLPDRPVLTLKSSGLNVTNQSVKENDTVTFVCVGKARPKPSVKLMRDEQLLQSTDPSSAKDDEIRMSHILRGTLEQLTFDLVAYPLPNVTIAYDALDPYGANTPRLVNKDKFNGTCEETVVTHHVRCNIWIQDVVLDDKGSYQLTVQNSEGSLDTLKFQLFVDGWKAYERPPPARLWEMHEYRALSPKPAPPRPSTVASDVADANPYDVIPADDATLDTARASCNYDDCFNVATSTEDNVDQSEGTHHPVLEQASPEYSNIPHDEGQDHAPYSNVP
nr:hypothetical protein BaRGS_034938 [Batillaria attramentaria]